MFPEKSKWLKMTIGWRDLGEVDGLDAYVEVHKFCNRELHIGAENSGELFKFCPRCLVKICGLESILAPQPQKSNYEE